jgi:hypothetical protein
MAHTIKLKKLCHGKDLDHVDNKVFLHSLHSLKALPGYQSTKAKYAADTKPFFQSKHFEVNTKFKNVELPSNLALAAANYQPPQTANSTQDQRNLPQQQSNLPPGVVDLSSQ